MAAIFIDAMVNSRPTNGSMDEYNFLWTVFEEKGGKQKRKKNRKKRKETKPKEETKAINVAIFSFMHQ